MKLKVLFTAMLISCLSVFAVAEQINPADENIFNINNAFEKARAEQKPIYFVVASASCVHCVDYLNSTIKSNFEVLNRDFAFALSDLTKGDAIPDGLPFDGTTPTTYILTPNGEMMIAPIKGNFNSDYLHMVLNKLYDSYTNNY